MGYDPFWPVSLATINVLCVPAAPISNARFDHILAALRLVQYVKLKDLDFDQDDFNDQLDPTASPEGVVFYNYSRAINGSELNRFPYETNGQSQLVLCLLDQLDSQASSHDEELHDVHRKFMTRYGEDDGESSSLICLRSQAVEADVSSMAIIAESLQVVSLYKAMTKVTHSLIINMKEAIIDILAKPVDNPKILTTTVVNGHTSSASSLAQSTSPDTPKDETMLNGDSHSSEVKGSDNTPSNIQSWRHLVVLGSMNLQAGCWHSAKNILTQGAIQARKNRDLFWEICAIERLLLCMTLLAWSESDFVVPEVCDPGRPLSTSISATMSQASSAVFQATTKTQPESAGLKDSAAHLLRSAPAMIEMLLNMHDHLKANQNLAIPPILLSELRIRLLNFLIFVNRGGTKPINNSIDYLLHPERHTETTSNSVWLSSSAQTKISTMLIEWLSFAEQTLGSTNYVRTLIAVLNSLLSLGSSRRHAFYFRDLLQRLNAFLTQARKAGALEVGIHPSAAMSMIQDGNKDDSASTLNGVRTLLDAAVTSFGIPLPRFSPQWNIRHANVDDISTNLDSWTVIQQTGDVLLKLEILRHCIGVCEALPDLESSLYFMSQLLRSAKQVITVSARSQNLPPLISPDEQMRLVEGIRKTASASPRLGWGRARAAFWDDFLVRGIELVVPLSESKLIPHSASELNIIDESSSNGVRDPFIFNPFARSTAAGSAPVIVAGESVTFSVMLQNPLQTDIDIEDISLWAEDCDFIPAHHSIVLGQMCSQTFNLNGIANKTGDLKIRGCIARIRGCEDQEFLTFKQDCQPLTIRKQKLRITATEDSSKDYVNDATKTDSTKQRPEPSILNVKVIDPQPIIETINTSLEQPSIMLLEGEKKSFSWSIKNESDTVPADFILFTYNDNVTTNLQDAMNRKDILPVETYEMQHQIKHKPTIRAGPLAAKGLSSEMLPKKDEDFTFEIFGRPGLMNATVQMNFAHLGMPRSELKHTFYTRQRQFPINVTVNGSIEIPRCNIIPLSGDFVWKAKRTTRQDVQDCFWGVVEEDCCLLLLDLRNVWPQPLAVTLEVQKSGNQIEAAETVIGAQTTKELLQPGHVFRLILLIPRIFVADPYAVIPNLGSQRQFVVSSSKLSLEAEAASREAFWYREELLKHLRGTWKDELSGRYGEIDLRKAIRLNPRMIDALKIDQVDISFHVEQSQNRAQAPLPNTVKQVGNTHYLLQTESFATLLIRVRNRTSNQLRLLLRLQPSLRDQPHNLALDLSRRFIWSGVLQQSLNPAVGAGETFETDLGIMALSEGHYEINATVEEIVGRKKVGSELNLDVAKPNPERRIWHARSPCLIDAVGGPP